MIALSAEEFVIAARTAIEKARTLTRKDDLCHELGQIIDASQLDVVDAQLAFKAFIDQQFLPSRAVEETEAKKFEELTRHAFEMRNIAQDLFVRLGCRKVLP